MEGEGDNMTYTKGHERIPENWYRTPVDYGLVSLNLDIVLLITQHPELLRYEKKNWNMNPALTKCRG